MLIEFYKSWSKHSIFWANPEFNVEKTVLYLVIFNPLFLLQMKKPR